MTRPNNATKFIERERERENEFKEINYKTTLKKIVRKSKDTQILKQGAEKMEKKYAHAAISLACNKVCVPFSSKVGKNREIL
jgi:hypothetical protein